MAFSFVTAQVIALLFTTGSIVQVAVEDSAPPHRFELENSDTGVTSLAEKLAPFRDMKREPFFCIGVAPGAKFDGVLAKEMMSAPIRRFVLAQPMYQLFAKTEGLNPNDEQTLLLACRRQFPKEKRAI
jgi:hypothetical protein